ncbi:ROK family protein [Clostridium chauvoei]|uniref:ROK family protein n=1 Tax=Clostridium chauvoei TaxID=46867 RepID=UPI001C852467|nr:ROK family protein [Clostridium chauvoei]MBX7420697.1 ROK family protein [Clostridium chauvoei]
MNKYICIDVGGTSIKYGVLEENGNFILKDQIDTEAYKGGQNILEKIKLIVKKHKNNFDIKGIGISTAGMVDPNEGKIVYASNLIPNYIGVEIKKELEKEFNIRCEVENDVNCAGLGEMWLGSAKGCKSCVCLTIGTGIGGCIILNNSVLHGHSNSAGEVGYMNINGGEFQKLAATSALVRNVAKRNNINSKDINGKIIFDLAKKGDAICIEEIDKIVDILAVGVSNIVYVINPEVVVLGGGIMAQREYLKDRIDNALKTKLIESVYKNTRLEFAKGDNESGMLGALFNLLQRNKKLLKEV